MVLASALVLGGSTLISGCTTSDNELVVENDKTPSAQKAGTFTFQLNGTKARSSFAPVSRAEDTHAFESDIKTVYVAFFTKKENTEESTLKKLYINDNADSENGATITKANDGNSYTITDENLFTGDYIAYFIANPGAKLKEKLNILTAGASKLSDFKAISIEEDTPNGGDTKDSKNGTGFVMISDEMNITITEDKTTSNITMTRLGARFDIINTQPTTGDEGSKHGATITNVTITNEAVKSDLIVPAANTNANYLSTKEATQWTTDATEMTFYTYENFPNGVNDNTFLTVTYTLDGSSTSKTLTIYLTDKNTGTQLGVKRNHLYNIYLNCVTGQYTLDVKDWDEGETVNIPDKNIYVEYTADDLGKIGDYVYNDNGTLKFSDGGLRKMYLNGTLDWQPVNERTGAVKDRGTCVGIVFSNLTSQKDQEAGFTHGYVLALKWSGDDYSYWGDTEQQKSDVSEIPNIGTYSDALTDLDGRYYSTILKGSNMDYINKYTPAVPTTGDTKTSEWYMPSIGQWYAIIRNLGGVTQAPLTNTIGGGNGWNKTNTGQEYIAQFVFDNINARHKGLDTSEYTPMKDSGFWSSTEYSNDRANRIAMVKDHIDFYNYSKSTGVGAWAVFAW